MLTTSPRIASSTNASPTTFQYAPTHVSSSRPPSSPSLVSASLTKRRSASRSSSLSMTCPSIQQSPTPAVSRQHPQTTSPPKQVQAAQPKRYAAVDTDGQHSPMDPAIMISPSFAGEVTTTMPASSPRTFAKPHPQQIDSTISGSRASMIGPSSSSSSSSSSPSVPTIRRQGPGNTTPSPGKRRTSQDHVPAPPPDPPVHAGLEKSGAAKRQRPEPRPLKVLPLRYELCSREDMVILIAHMLSELIETNDALALRSGSLTRFHSR